MSLTAAPRVAEGAFLALPESNRKVELLDGNVIVSPSPTFWHQQIVKRIVLALERWAEQQERPVTVVQAPLDVRFGPDRILQPDAMVFLAHLGSDEAGPIARVPEIVVEVLSADRTYDRVTKRHIYAASGVGEYWIADPAGSVIERRTGPGLADEQVVRDRLTSPLLPGFFLDVARLYADVRR